MKEGVTVKQIMDMIYGSFTTNIVEPDITLFDKLWVDSLHKLHYNENGTDYILANTDNAPWYRDLLTSTIYPLTPNDNLNIGNGTFTCSALYDAYVTGGIAIGELGQTALDPFYTATSIVGAFNQIASGGVSSFLDSTFEIKNSVDNTKKINFDASYVSPGSVSTITVPDRDIALDYISDSITDTNIPANRMLVSNGSKITSLPVPASIINYIKNLNAYSVTGDGMDVTVECSSAHLLSNGDVVVMSGWDAGFDGTYAIVVVDPDTFTYTNATVGVSTAIGTATYVIGTNTELVDVVLAKYKCNDLIIENLSGTSVTIDIGTTLGGSEIISNLVCAAGSIEHIFVNQIYSSSTDQSIFISSSSWTTAYVDVHINQTKVMN